MEPKSSDQFVLPVSIVSPTDVARLTREIEGVDNFFRENSIRQSGESNTIPRLSKLMDQLVTNNQLNLLQDEDRRKVSEMLHKLHENAPVMHISFSVDPPGPYVQKIVDWLRRNIHSQVLVTVGLQPNIGAGCVVRTTNKLFDFSLREFFKQKRQFFIEKLHVAISDPVNSYPDIEANPESSEVAKQLQSEDTHEVEVSQSTAEAQGDLTNNPIPQPINESVSNEPEAENQSVDVVPQPLPSESPNTEVSETNQAGSA